LFVANGQHVPPIAYKLRSPSDLAWSNYISGGDTSAQSTRISIGIGRCIYSNTRIGSFRCVPVSSVL